jgi:hypothetical protein
VRRECLDQVLIFGEAHLRQILSSYAAPYNNVRTHLALGKDAPAGRAVQRIGVIVTIPILVGLPTITSGYDFRKAQGIDCPWADDVDADPAGGVFDRSPLRSVKQCLFLLTSPRRVVSIIVPLPRRDSRWRRNTEGV